ncbi:hypothetical protein KIN20_007433 [Parelaphostrongylus tenuis]|uniref:Uncharacterized protein n=1 Tax=Parelaphostrongylus tenuis TaxID=148309 RepID=A0AAD5QGV8_PARTN|nr:hypothetical protein KIN20_007433 [Parelaphostrongylus tenuis]
MTNEEASESNGLLKHGQTGTPELALACFARHTSSALLSLPVRLQGSESREIQQDQVSVSRTTLTNFNIICGKIVGY